MLKSVDGNIVYKLFNDYVEIVCVMHTLQRDT